MEEDLAVLGNLHPDLAALFIGMRPGDPLSPQQAMFLDAARVGSAPAPAPAPSPIAAATESVPSFGYTAEEFRNLSPAMRNAALLQFTEDLGSMRP